MFSGMIYDPRHVTRGEIVVIRTLIGLLSSSMPVYRITLTYTVTRFPLVPVEYQNSRSPVTTNPEK